MFYGFCMLFTKLAILFQNKRIFTTRATRNSVWWLIILLMVLDTLYYIAAIIVEIAQCTLREMIWNPLVEGTCINNNANVVAAGGFNFG
ncbi:MAG: hypothetical protein LQ340_006073, partial [Diploschistes diacapsis]